MIAYECAYLRLLNDLGVLEEVDAVAADGLALEGDGLACVIGELGVQRLMLAYNHIDLAIAAALDANGQAAGDAMLGAGGMLCALGAVVGVANEVEDLAGDGGGGIGGLIVGAGKERKSGADGENQQEFFHGKRDCSLTIRS